MVAEPRPQVLGARLLAVPRAEVQVRAEHGGAAREAEEAEAIAKVVAEVISRSSVCDSRGKVIGYCQKAGDDSQSRDDTLMVITSSSLFTHLPTCTGGGGRGG